MISFVKKTSMPFAKRIRRLKALPRAKSGVAMVEFAFTAPIVLALGMMGTETAYYAISHMQLSQVTMQVADNASRVGEQDVLVERRVFEDDINEVLVGAEKLGERIEIYERGRIILSSLQRNEEGGQWIQWQRCRGAKNHTSSYGVEGTGEFGTAFQGMGRDGSLITAAEGTAVMFVEVAYDYEALTPFEFLDGRELTYTAAFNVRDNRDLTQLHPSQSGQNTARCNVFSAERP